MIEQIKLITQTKKGTKLRVPAAIERVDDRIFFVKAPFELKGEIKAMQGSRWHGYIPDDGRQMWSVDDSIRNNFQLDFMTGGDPYANWDQPLKNFGYSRSLYDHQRLMSDMVLTYHYQLLAAEMGCISGAAVVQVSRSKAKGNTRSYTMTLRELYQRTSGAYKCQGKKWDNALPTYIYALSDKGLTHTGITKVLAKGVQPVVTVKLKDGRSLTVTDDHEMYTGWRTKKPASELSPGDMIVVTGTKCSESKLTHDIQPVWDGKKMTSLGSWTRLNSEGYVEVGGIRSDYPVGWLTSNGDKVVKEQYLVMEEHLGLIPGEFIIHHLNGIRHDNRIENLALLKKSSHSKLHAMEPQHKSKFVPCFGEVESVEVSEPVDVYDIVCDHPHHNFVADGFVVANCGKTLSAIEIMEHSQTTDWFYVAPKGGLVAVEREFSKWGLNFQPRMMTYDRLRIEIEKWEPGQPAPVGVVFDESQRLKTATAKRTKAAQHLADSIRREYGWNGYVIGMSGTPSPKSPVDWWAQCEVIYPGFLKEGSAKAFEWRLGIFEKQQTDQGEFWKRVSWRDNENKCDKCGEYVDHKNHSTDDLFGSGDNAHEFVPSKNEVAYLHKRLKGLVLPLAKKDCLDIPDKIYREVILEPTTTLKRVAKALAKSAISAIQGLTWLRELSDGFQYHDVQDGEKVCPVCDGDCNCEQWVTNPQTDESESVLCECKKCEGTGRVPNMVRESKEIKCPKDQAIRDLLEENEDHGRLVIFTGFQGSNDRVVKLCHKQQWNVVKVDGRGWKILPCNGEKPPRDLQPLDYWADMRNERVVFVAHPASGGVGLTLTEACMAVFYSNDFTPESRAQAEDRIHRPGIDENKGATIVDLFHLGTDRRVLDVLKDNRRLEKMTLEEMQEMI